MQFKLADPMLSLTLNRRHRAGLFLVLVAAGLSLFLEASVKQTAGIALLGLAATWLLGSLSIRALGILCSLTVFAVGFSVAAIPVWEDWQTWYGSFKQYTAAIEDLRLAISKAPVMELDKEPLRADQLDTVQHPTLGTLRFPKDMPYQERNEAIKNLEKSAPKKKSDEGDWVDVAPPEAPHALRIESNAAGPTKTIDLPESTQRWKRPNVSESGGEFPSKTPDETILLSIKRDFLLPEPTFSLGASFRLHLLTILVGFALAAAGLSGCGWYIRSAIRAKRNQAATT